MIFSCDPPMDARRLNSISCSNASAAAHGTRKIVLWHIRRGFRSNDASIGCLDCWEPPVDDMAPDNCWWKPSTSLDTPRLVGRDCSLLTKLSPIVNTTITTFSILALEPREARYCSSPFIVSTYGPGNLLDSAVLSLRRPCCYR